MLGEEITLKELISSYNELSVADKRRELGREIAELILVVKKIISDNAGGLPLGENVLEEFENLYDASSSESEYLTGLYEDIVNFKDLLGLLLSKILIDDSEN